MTRNLRTYKRCRFSFSASSRPGIFRCAGADWPPLLMSRIGGHALHARSQLSQRLILGVAIRPPVWL